MNTAVFAFKKGGVPLYQKGIFENQGDTSSVSSITHVSLLFPVFSRDVTQVLATMGQQSGGEVA